MGSHCGERGFPCRESMRSLRFFLVSRFKVAGQGHRISGTEAPSPKGIFSVMIGDPSCGVRGRILVETGNLLYDAATNGHHFTVRIPMFAVFESLILRQRDTLHEF